MKENPKHTDHHFTPISEYKYTFEFVEPRKTYEELQKENEALKLTFQVLKTATELFNNLKKVNDFAKGGIVNSNSEGPEMVFNEKKHIIFEEGRTISNETIESLKGVLFPKL